MRVSSIVQKLSPVVLTLFLAGCGSGQSNNKPASEPAAESATGESEAASKAEEAKAEKEEPEAAEEPAKIATAIRSPKDIITAPDTVFMFSFNASEPFQKADKECAEKSKDDPKKMADCMSKARKGFDADGFQFKEGEDGKWWWITHRKKGDRLIAVHRIQFEFGEEKDKTITIKPTGKDKGSSPMARVPKEMQFEVPNDSEIVVDDPKHGKLVYQAKIGIVGDQPPQR